MAATANTDDKNPPEVTSPDKKVCRPIAATGSHMRKRICHTKAEWAEFDHSVGAAAEQTLERRRAPTAGGVESF